MKSAIKSFRVKAGTERKKWLSKKETLTYKKAAAVMQSKRNG